MREIKRTRKSRKRVWGAYDSLRPPQMAAVIGGKTVLTVWLLVACSLLIPASSQKGQEPPSPKPIPQPRLTVMNELSPLPPQKTPPRPFAPVEAVDVEAVCVALSKPVNPFPKNAKDLTRKEKKKGKILVERVLDCVVEARRSGAWNTVRAVCDALDFPLEKAQALVIRESDFGQNAVNQKSGARSLVQFLPDSFVSAFGLYGKKIMPHVKAHDPEAFKRMQSLFRFIVVKSGSIFYDADAYRKAYPKAAKWGDKQIKAAIEKKILGFLFDERDVAALPGLVPALIAFQQIKDNEVLGAPEAMAELQNNFGVDGARLLWEASLKTPQRKLYDVIFSLRSGTIPDETARRRWTKKVMVQNGYKDSSGRPDRKMTIWQFMRDREERWSMMVAALRQCGEKIETTHRLNGHLASAQKPYRVQLSLLGKSLPPSFPGVLLPDMPQKIIQICALK